MCSHIQQVLLFIWYPINSKTLGEEPQMLYLWDDIGGGYHNHVNSCWGLWHYFCSTFHELTEQKLSLNHLQLHNTAQLMEEKDHAQLFPMMWNFLFGKEITVGVSSVGQIASYNLTISFLYHWEEQIHPKTFKSFVGDVIGLKAIQLFDDD